MAAKLECSVGAIVRDLESVEWALSQRIEPDEATQILNETLAELSAVKDIALGALEKATGNVRVGLLNTALRAVAMPGAYPIAVGRASIIRDTTRP